MLVSSIENEMFKSRYIKAFPEIICRLSRSSKEVPHCRKKWNGSLGQCVCYYLKGCIILVKVLCVNQSMKMKLCCDVGVTS